MKTRAKLLAALAATAIGCTTSISAHAGDDGWKRHHRGHPHQKHWQHGRYGHGHVVHRHVVVERPVYVARPVYVSRPVYVEHPVYVERHVHYAPPPRYPGVVVSVNLPPIVFPLR